MLAAVRIKSVELYPRQLLKIAGYVDTGADLRDQFAKIAGFGLGNGGARPAVGGEVDYMGHRLCFLMTPVSTAGLVFRG